MPLSPRRRRLRGETPRRGDPSSPMQPLESRLQERFPHWFRGRRASLARPLLRTIGRWSRFDQVEAFLQANGELRDFAFVGAALDHLQARYVADAAEVRTDSGHGPPADRRQPPVRRASTRLHC